MADAFIEALADLKDALTNDEEVAAAIAEVAAEHGLKPEALRNRAVTAWGDLAAYGAKSREREIEAIARAKEADAIVIARAAMAKPQSEWENWTEEEKRAVHTAQSTNRFWQ